MLEWVSGTGLRPILNDLAGEDRVRFLDRYRGALRDAYPRRADGTTLYPFPRALRRRDLFRDNPDVAHASRD